MNRQRSIMKEPFVMDATVLIGAWLGLISAGAAMIVPWLGEVALEAGVPEKIVDFVDGEVFGQLVIIIILMAILRHWESRRKQSYSFKIMASSQGTWTARLSGLASFAFGLMALGALVGRVIGMLPVGSVPTSLALPLMEWSRSANPWIIVLGVIMPVFQIALFVWWVVSRRRAMNAERPKKEKRSRKEKRSEKTSDEDAETDEDVAVTQEIMRSVDEEES